MAGSLMGVAFWACVVAFASVALWKGPRRAWAIWKRIGQMIGDVVARVAMTVFFFTILVPFAMVAKRRHDPLGLRATDAACWLPAARQSVGLEAARRQY